MSVLDHTNDHPVAQAKRALRRAEEASKDEGRDVSLIGIGYAILALADAISRGAETLRNG